MKLFKVYYYSSCGSYFAAYLKSVSVVAADRQKAVEKVKLWVDTTGNDFIESNPQKWGVEELIIDPDGVFDYDESSDY